MQALSFLVAALVLLLASVSVLSAPAPPNSIQMKVVNHAGAPIELFWVNTFKTPEELVMQTTKPIRNNSDTNINSYHTHEFIAKFLKPVGAQVGAEVRFAKGPREEVITVSFSPELGMTAKQVTKFDEIMDTIKGATTVCSASLPREDEDAFAKCVADAMIDDITRLTDSKTQLVKHRDLMSSRLRNYTCVDDEMNTTKPISSYNITIEKTQFTVDTLFDSNHAKVWTVDDFISPSECEILRKHGESRLKRATVAAEDGSSVVSENRKAQQASYNMHMSNPSADPLYSLYQRVLALTNHHGKFNLKHDGQEDFTIIQYNVADQYTPHCDGTCDGSKHISGGRVATAVLYCQVAERGGGTTFTKSDLFVKPKNGQATFFSYRGDDGRMDEGYTEHSGCPVLEGEKWITTVWMRDGVTKEEPWTLFDPNGVRMMEPDVEPADTTHKEEL